MVGYKWLHIFDNNGLVGLKGNERSARPPDVFKEIRIEIRQELADSNAGWDFIQVMDLIHDKIGVRYHKVHIYRLLHNGGFKSKVSKKRFVNTPSSAKEKEIFKKE